MTKPEDTVLSGKISTRLSRPDFERVVAAVAESGVSISEWVRSAVLAGLASAAEDHTTRKPPLPPQYLRFWVKCPWCCKLLFGRDLIVKYFHWKEHEKRLTGSKGERK